MLRVSIAIAKRETARIFGAAKGRLALGLFWIWALLPGLYRALSQLEMDERQQQAHVMAIIKGINGQRFRLPVVSDFADKM